MGNNQISKMNTVADVSLTAITVKTGVAVKVVDRWCYCVVVVTALTECCLQTVKLILFLLFMFESV